MGDDQHPTEADVQSQLQQIMSLPIIAKVSVARWRTARVIISLFLSNQSQQSRSSAIANDVLSTVHIRANCGM